MKHFFRSFIPGIKDVQNMFTKIEFKHHLLLYSLSTTLWALFFWEDFHPNIIKPGLF